jgi:hypothetical protein
VGTDSWREAKLVKSEEERQQENQESKRDGERGRDAFTERSSTGGNGSGSAPFEFRSGPWQIPMIIYVVFLNPSRRIPERFL